MSLIEVLIASVILLLTMLPMGILLTSVSSSAAEARQRQAALQLADSWVEILSNTQPPTSTDPSQPPGSVLTNQPTTPVAPANTQTPSSTLGGTTYRVQASYTENGVNSANGSDLCSAGQPPSAQHPGVIQLQVVVSWEANGHQTLTDTTEISYPKPGLQMDGFLAINLANDGEPDVNGNLALDRLEALPVTVTQTSGNPSVTLTPNPYVLYPDKNGCIFAQVPTGNYSVAVQQPISGTPSTFSGYSGAPPFVTPSGSTTDAQPNPNVPVVNVSVISETVVSLDPFDEGITANLKYGGASAVDDGVTCPNGGATTCIATGDGTSGASATWGGGSGTWNATALTAGTSINQVDCTTASTAYCVGVGNNSAGGVIATTPSSFNSVSYGTVSNGIVPAGVTDLTEVTCMSSMGCYALGTTNAGPVLLAGAVGPGADKWAVVAPTGISFTALNSISCPTSSTCELSYTGVAGAPGVLRLIGDPTALATIPSWTPIISSDILPNAVTAVGIIACPSASICEATAVGDQFNPSDATVISVLVSVSSQWNPETSFPSSASSVTGISCTATTCVAIGTATGGPAVWTGDLTGGHSWVQANGIPNTPNPLVSLTSVACGNPGSGDSADCAVAGLTSAPSGAGLLLDGSLSSPGGNWLWNNANVPTSDTVQYFVGVSCESPASSTSATCAAVGATSGGPVVLASSTGPSGTWSDVTPPSLPGSVVTGIPLEVSLSDAISYSTVIPWTAASVGTSNASSLPNPLYPDSNGYSIAAGDCLTEATKTMAGGHVVPSSIATASFNAAPGGSATVTVPLGLLGLQLIGTTGAPISGAVVTLTSLTCPGSDSYDMPVTDATGVTMTSVPYGWYSYTVTQGTSAVAYTAVTLVVGANSVQIQSGSGGPWTTYYLPNPAPVAG